MFTHFTLIWEINKNFHFPFHFLIRKEEGSNFKLMTFKGNTKSMVIDCIQDKYLGEVLGSLYYYYIFFPKSKYIFSLGYYGLKYFLPSLERIH